jgi:hypothetical protein
MGPPCRVQKKKTKNKLKLGPKPRVYKMRIQQKDEPRFNN